MARVDILFLRDPRFPAFLKYTYVRMLVFHLEQRYATWHEKNQSFNF